MVPLQSLSMPSQVSGWGSLELEQVHPARPPQTIVPLLQGATRVPSPLQAAPVGGHQCRLEYEQQLPGRSQQPFMLPGGASASGASSISVSQSLSLPSQTSGAGPIAPWQTIAPFTHA